MSWRGITLDILLPSNRFCFLFTAGFIGSELVNERITSRSTEVPSPRVGVLDEIALALDVNSKVLANWGKLALALKVPRKIFKQFERRSVQSPTNQLFEYLASTCPQMTLKPLKEALKRMTRNDLLKLLLNLEGTFTDQTTSELLNTRPILNCTNVLLPRSRSHQTMLNS